MAPIFFASMTSSLVLAIALIALATAALQDWSANLFTTVSDLFPKRAVGSVTGIGGMMGGIGGALVAAFAGKIIATTGSYLPLFIFASCAYLVALLIVQMLAPNPEPVKLADEAAA